MGAGAIYDLLDLVKHLTIYVMLLTLKTPFKKERSISVCKWLKQC
jgi:hypothetical protein